MVVNGNFPMKKIITEWTFAQSTGMIVSLLLNAVCLVFCYFMWQEIKVLRQDYKDLAQYERTKMEAQLDKNTDILGRVESYLHGQKSR